MALAFLSSEANGALPLAAVTRETFAAWRAQQSERDRNWLDATGFTGEAGKLAFLPGPDGRPARVVAGTPEKEPLWCLAGLPEALPEGRYALEEPLGGAAATRAALGWALGTYAFTRYKERTRGFATLVWPERADRAEVERLARAIFLTRDLVNTPAEDMGPPHLAAAAEHLAREFGARCTVIAGDALLEQNYPTIHAVGRAASRPPCLIDLRWGDEAAPKVTLVGKGVCFDSGGLDLKTAAGMKLMKKDMGGAATAMGLASALMAAGAPIRLRLLVPAVENAVSGNAMRPLDIVRTRSGKTVEIGNTDAEGRLILCDALAEADREKPALLADFATLTGAARVALGPDLPALFCNDDALAEALLRAGGAESDPLWRMPLFQPYRKMIDSKAADLNNVADWPYAGAIIAALYLAEFVAPSTPWAHLDILAWNTSAKPGRPEGGEAMGLRALYAHIRERFG
ncbi:MAG TPA: leucyl aminopeptidase family protein [Stellaceae bacterium]|nr:leucyl aminopeptidase family protein [Stellaceae bacterium]